LPTKSAQISNLSRGISLGKARRKPISNSDVRISPITRTTPKSRGRGTTANPVSSRTVNPGRIVSSRKPAIKNGPPTKPTSGGSKILANLIQIAGSKENNPVEKAAKVASPSISPTVAKISSITPRRPINQNQNQVKNSVPNPFVIQSKPNPRKPINIGINSQNKGRQNSRFKVEQDRTAAFSIGKESQQVFEQNTNDIQAVNVNEQPKRIQTPRRPITINEDYDERDDDRTISHVDRPRKRPEERNRPQIKKHKSSSGKPRPPTAAGCFQICDTLIFEVYKLLGGGLCDC